MIASSCKCGYYALESQGQVWCIRTRIILRRKSLRRHRTIDPRKAVVLVEITIDMIAIWPTLTTSPAAPGRIVDMMFGAESSGS
jgi:hypothetical protein